MKASNEFVVGKHGIGYVSSSFKSKFEEVEFELTGKPTTFKKLGRSMTDAEIEKELKPGICSLGNVLAFMDNAPDECKDGWANIFYFPECVVLVHWDGGEWDVGTWERNVLAWGSDSRVFSPDRGDIGMENTSGATQEMPRYKSHKEVWALKIKKIDIGIETAIITPEDSNYSPFNVDSEYMVKHQPKVGGYYVVYKDGYRSFSPADAFEEGYTRLN